MKMKRGDGHGPTTGRTRRKGKVKQKIPMCLPVAIPANALALSKTKRRSIATALTRDKEMVICTIGRLRGIGRSSERGTGSTSFCLHVSPEC